MAKRVAPLLGAQPDALLFDRRQIAGNGKSLPWKQACAALPPGEYIIDVEGRVPKRLHVRAQPFTVVPNETVHVDMTIVTGFGAEASASQE